MLRSVNCSMKRVQLTTGLFLAGCLLITAIQLVTDPITCDVKVSF